MKTKRTATILLLLAFVAILASSCQKKACPAYSDVATNSVENIA
ncbi:hypothetical protein [Tenuifilum thalassicum]|nr:hypothetical protein [Tenuifilum thalassicum]